MGEKEFLHKDDELLITYLTGMAEDDERKAAIAWIHESAENRRYFDELKEIYKTSRSAKAAENIDVDLSWARVKARHFSEMNEMLREEIADRKYYFIREIIKYAALIALAVSISYSGFRFFRNRSAILSGEIWNTVEAPFGSRTHLTLSDGSKVWLNAGSSLKYSSRYGVENRKVVLEGEAYFSVEKDTARQFIVSTSHLDIKVYGTEFNVEAYSSDGKIRTTLVSGSITLEGDLVSKTDRRSITLEPNQTAIYYIRGDAGESEPETDAVRERQTSGLKRISPENVVVTRVTNPIIYTSWKDPIWQIDGETLQSLATKFERRFNIRFVFDSKAIQNYRFSGKLKDEPLELVLNILRLSLPIDYRIQNNQVVITENKYYRNSYDEMLKEETN